MVLEYRVILEHRESLLQKQVRLSLLVRTGDVLGQSALSCYCQWSLRSCEERELCRKTREANELFFKKKGKGGIYKSQRLDLMLINGQIPEENKSLSKVLVSGGYHPLPFPFLTGFC